MKVSIPTQIRIIKASGKEEFLSEEKLKNSLIRSGAGQELADRVIKAIRLSIHDGMYTHKIHRLAHNLLKKFSKTCAFSYNIRQAIMELGPSGFPFERYIAALLEHNGYKTTLDKILQGKCVTHEIDIIAQKEGKLFLSECKYHNSRGINCDIKVVLYIHARFLDVVQKDINKDFEQAWLFTNTKFSEDAIKYASCAGLRLTGWNYPNGNSLRDMISKSGLFPLTSLPDLSKEEKRKLLAEGIILARDVEKYRKIER